MGYITAWLLLLSFQRDVGNERKIILKNLMHWLKKSKTIQWDNKNIVKRRGVLVRILLGQPS